MHYSAVLSLVAAIPIVLAAPASTTNTTSCVSQQWAIEGFSTFDAAKGPAKAGTPAVFNASHLSFRFEDPNTNLTTSCHRQLKAGAGGHMADKHRHSACDDSSVQYKFDGKVLEVRHKFKCNGKKTITSSASIEGAVVCMDRYGGVQCSTAITEVNVKPEIL